MLKKMRILKKMLTYDWQWSNFKSLFSNSFILILSACIFSFIHYAQKINCLVMRTKQLIIESKLSKKKSTIFTNCV